MRTKLNQTFAISMTKVIISLGLLLLLVDCVDNSTKNEEVSSKSTVNNLKKTYWQVKAIHPSGKFLDIKAIDGYGNSFNIKAIQVADQKSLMDIKAFIGNKVVSIKILVNDGKLAPVKAIAKDGTLYNIKAIAANGDRLSIKGVKRSGNIVHIKAIDKNGTYYGVKAISPKGELNDVKGVKMSKKDLEYTLYGAQIYAHIKALPQTGCVSDNFLWHIVAMHPEGYTLEVKALDKDGNAYDVKAIRDADQQSLLDIKAFVGDTDQLPVKLLISDDIYKPLKAIKEDGTLYDIKAITPDGDKLDVKGISRSGNIIHIKAIAKDGTFYGIKALSPKGELNDVKGVKMFKRPLELKVNGVEVYAHVKALSQGD
jgi:hypothetical protein